MKNLLFYIIGVILLTICLSFSATALDKGLCLEQEIVDITPSSIKVDEDFTVGVEIQSCGDIMAKNITFELKRVSPNIIVKEDKITYIDSMKCIQCNKFLLYNMRTSHDATPGEYVIETELTYGSGLSDWNFMKKKNFTITIISDRAKLNIASIKTDPILPKLGESTTITVRIENFGDGKANSVKGEIDLPFDGIKQSFLGRLNSGEDGPLVFTVIPDKSGEINYQLKIKYSDDYGKHEITENLNLAIIKQTNWRIIAGIIIIVVILIIIFLKFKNKKRTQNIDEIFKGKQNEPETRRQFY